MDQSAIVHSDDCDKSIFKLKCKECKRSYNTERKRKLRNKNKCQQLTSSISAKKNSKYDELFCENCKGKSAKEICIECTKKYKTAIHTNSKQKKHETAKSVHINQTIQSNQQDQTDLPVSAGKKRSIYSDDICTDCKGKKLKEFCDACTTAYNCAKSNRSYSMKKTKKRPN